MIKFNNQEQETVTGVYTESTRLSPISKTKKNTVLKDYGLAAGWSRGKSDTAISKKAADAVLKKFRDDQAKAKAAAAKAAAAKNPPAKTPTPAKVVQPTVLPRATAAQLSRKYGFDPAKLFGYGLKGRNMNDWWVNQTSQAHIWKNAANFEAWLKRVVKQTNASIYR